MRLGHRHQLLNLFVERIALGDDLIDDAEGSGVSKTLFRATRRALGQDWCWAAIFRLLAMTDEMAMTSLIVPSPRLLILTLEQVVG